MYPAFPTNYKIQLKKPLQIPVIRSRKTNDRQCHGQKKRPKGQTMIYKTLCRKLKIEQHEPHKVGINAGAP